MRIAVILSCYNRKESTRECLNSLGKVLSVNQIDVFLTDDGSTDGTSEMITKEFPTVHLINGDGKQFWSRGMYLSWKEALKGCYDFYLWLNDDIILYSNFMDELFNSLEKAGRNAIVSGLIENEEKTEIIYGGYNKQKKMVQPSIMPSSITYMNGNVVLVPKAVVNTIGIIDPVYHHDLGDVDYGLRAMKAGFNVVATCNPVAYGYKNSYCRVREWNSSLSGRFKKLYNPLGSNPSINFYFRKKHFGILNAISYWGYLHLINVLPDRMINILFGNRYVDERC